MAIINDTYLPEDMVLELDRFHNTFVNPAEDILVETLEIQKIHSLARHVIAEVAHKRGKTLLQHHDGHVSADSSGVIPLRWHEEDPRSIYASVGMVEISRRPPDIRQIAKTTIYFGLAFPFSRDVVEFNAEHKIARPRFDLPDGSTALVQWLDGRTHSTADETVQRLVGPVRPIEVDLAEGHAVLRFMRNRIIDIRNSAMHPETFNV